jgi:cytochrome c-type biogenesis protein CcmF
VYTKARLQGLRAAGGYLSHVGVAIMLLGIVASGGYDHSTKISLALDQPQQVGDRTLTFVGFLEKTSPRDKDTLVIDVVDADGTKSRSYPKFFRNERTGQVMMNPHVRSTALADFYVSPLQYDPGEPAGAGKMVELARGQQLAVGDYQIRFAGFDLGVGGGNALTQMAAGGNVTLGVQVDVTSPDGSTRKALPLYKIDQARGMVETPPEALPAGGTVTVAGINANEGVVRLAVQGAPGLSTEGKPPTVSVDVTEKPLIQLVWIGLYVILAGGGLAIFTRARQAVQPA